MSERQAQPSVTLKWGDHIYLLTEARRKELAERLWSWKPEQVSENKRGPFDGIHLIGVEVFWLAICALAGPQGDIVPRAI